MRNLLTAVLAVVLMGAAQTVAAQEVRGFAFGSSLSDLNQDPYPGFGGGVLVDLGQPWLAVGAQGEAFTEWPYFSGRGAVFAEGRPFPKSAVRPFLMAGAGFGEFGGPMFGGGIEFRVPRSRLAFRVTVEDYVRHDARYVFLQPAEPETRHQVATRFGISF